MIKKHFKNDSKAIFKIKQIPSFILKLLQKIVQSCSNNYKSKDSQKNSRKLFQSYSKNHKISKLYFKVTPKNIPKLL